MDWLRYIETLESRVNQLERRLNNIFREGSIKSVDYEKGLAVMDAGGIDTAPASWLTRAGAVRDWNPVTEGERAIFISPTGEPGQGLILPGGFSSAFPQNNNRGGEPRRTIGGYSFTENADGATWVAGGVTMMLTGAGLQIAAGDTGFTLGPGGYAQTGGEKRHDGRNVGSSHIHSGVQRGSANTDPPSN